MEVLTTESRSALPPGDQTLLCSRTSFWRPGRVGIKTGHSSEATGQWRPAWEASLAEAHYLHHSDQHCRGNWGSLIEPSDPQWSCRNSLTTPPDFIEKRIPLPPHNIFHWQQRKDERLLEES